MNETTPHGTDTPVADSAKDTHGIGPVIGASIIVAILVLGGIYYWMTKPLGTADTSRAHTTEATSPEAIERDLEASVDLDALDAEIDAELERIDAAFE